MAKRKHEEKSETLSEEEKERRLAGWVAKTEAGRLVQKGEIESLEQLFDRNLAILEPEIIDSLIPLLEVLVVDIKKTTKVMRSGRVFGFRASVLVGDRNRHIGIGIGNDRERLPAIKKATQEAKLSIIGIKRGCGSWECACNEEHSVPFKVEGKSASVRVMLLPAPKGTGLVVGNQIKQVLELAGIRDVWSRTKGSTATKLNFVRAAVDALRQVSRMKLSDNIERKLGGK